MKKISIYIVFLIISSICFSQEARPMVSNITVSTVSKDGQVTIGWFVSQEATHTIQELHVFRSSDGIIKPVTLNSGNEPIATLPSLSTQYTDTLLDYKNYYYAVVAVDINGNLFDVLIPTVNTTDSPVKRPNVVSTSLKQEEVIQPQIISPRPQQNIETPQRERPLPILQITQVDEQEAPLLTKETLLATNSHLGFNQQNEYFTTEILSIDMQGDKATGDDYTIFNIVDTYISKNDWLMAEEELERFLQTNRSKSSTARANFYLAQAMYFKQEYRSALFLFQQAKKVYPLQSNRWIEEVLNRYTVQ